MWRLLRRFGLAVLVLGLPWAWGCSGASENEAGFAKTPGSAPPGAPVNSEEAAPPAPTPKAP